MQCVCVWGGGGGCGVWGRKSDFLREKVQLLSRFLGFWTFGSRRAKRQSCSTRQGLRVSTDFVEFRQLREVEVFSYSVIFDFKSLVNGLECLRS